MFFKVVFALSSWKNIKMAWRKSQPKQKSEEKPEGKVNLRMKLRVDMSDKKRM